MRACLHVDQTTMASSLACVAGSLLVLAFRRWKSILYQFESASFLNNNNNNIVLFVLKELVERSLNAAHTRVSYTLLRDETLCEENEETNHLLITILFLFVFSFWSLSWLLDFRYLFNHTLSHFAGKDVSREFKRSAIIVIAISVSQQEVLKYGLKSHSNESRKKRLILVDTRLIVTYIHL